MPLVHYPGVSRADHGERHRPCGRGWQPMAQSIGWSAGVDVSLRIVLGAKSQHGEALLARVIARVSNGRD